MFYTPKFCCNCGEKIERPNPSLIDSKRFCDVCKHDFVVPRAVPVVFCVLMALVGLFGIGSYWRSGDKPPTVSARQFNPNPSPSGKNPATQTSQINSNITAPQAAPPVSVQKNAAPNRPPSRENETAAVLTESPVYFCGAETKKGTPCSRRVKGGGRCWQHKGQNALLPPEKLAAGR